jgi:hypothetical protein
MKAVAVTSHIVVYLLRAVSNGNESRYLCGLGEGNAKESQATAISLVEKSIGMEQWANAFRTCFIVMIFVW